jgi:hypothetical protein
MLCRVQGSSVDAAFSGPCSVFSLVGNSGSLNTTPRRLLQRVLRPGGPLLLSFHVGNEVQLKTQGYGGHPMRADVHRRRHGQMIAWLSDAGLAVETTRTLTSAESKLGGIILARRQVPAQPTERATASL